MSIAVDNVGSGVIEPEMEQGMTRSLVTSPLISHDESTQIVDDPNFQRESELSPSYDFTSQKWLNDVLAQCSVCIMEPNNYEKIAQDDLWKKAMQAEIDMIEKNHTWKLVKKKIIRQTCHWCKVGLQDITELEWHITEE